MDFDSFFHEIGLTAEVAEQALNTLKSEAVTIRQLIFTITDDDLEEIGISPETRTKILSRAEVFQFDLPFQPAHHF